MNLYKVQYLNADGGYISTQYIPAPSAAEAVDRVRYEDEYGNAYNITANKVTLDGPFSYEVKDRLKSPGRKLHERQMTELRRKMFERQMRKSGKWPSTRRLKYDYDFDAYL